MARSMWDGNSSRLSGDRPLDPDRGPEWRLEVPVWTPKREVLGAFTSDYLVHSFLGLWVRHSLCTGGSLGGLDNFTLAD